MLSLKWIMTTLRTNKQANEMVSLFKSLKPEIGGFDTETTGLHIILDKPFLFQFGFIDPNSKTGYTYVVDLDAQPEFAKAVINKWNTLAKTLRIYLAHNVKFDLHMLYNVGLAYNHNNVSDTMFYIRHAHDALTPANGGPPMALKDYSAKYIDHNAKSHEKALASEKSAIIKELHIKLKQRLSVCGVPPEKYNAKSYTTKVIDQMFKDPIVDYNDLEPDVKACYLAWLQEDVPVYMQSKVNGLLNPNLVRYDKLNRANVIRYGHYDIVYLLETYLLTYNSCVARETLNAVKIEEDLIYPLFEMERVGFKADKAYIEQCRINLKEYIQERRLRLYALANTELAIGQHALVKQILNNDYEVECSATNSGELDTIKNNLIRDGDTSGAVEFIDIIQELRTLEKWYSVYIMRFLNLLKNHDRLYTTINQVGTVSGRVTSDFQQFPKDAIKTVDGVELFQPRRMVSPTGGDYNAIVYLDYSQIELRFQAFYTILVGHPDLNLCRAYMPYKCVNPNGELFDYTNPTHIKTWDKEWYFEEEPEHHWVPTDVHGATTQEATGLTPADPNFAKLRSKIGKRVNFAKNYGAQFKKIWSMFPEKTEEEARRIDSAYYKAFPGVKHYHDYCYGRALHYTYTENLFGVKYYGVSGHKLINMLVQGSAAYYLKLKIIELYNYSKANNIKSRWQMQIHDELSWECHKDEPANTFFEFKKLMEDWAEAYVPVVADMEVTTKTWAEKVEVGTVEELKDISPRPVR